MRKPTPLPPIFPERNKLNEKEFIDLADCAFRHACLCEPVTHAGTIPATYNGMPVTAIAVPGDMDGDLEITRNDVISLLLRVTMPNRFPLTKPGKI